MRDADAVNVFRRMARVPSNRLTALPRLRQDIPQGFALPGAAGSRPQGRAVRRRFHEPVNAVEVGALAGGDRSPEDGRQHRLERQQVSHHALLDQAFQVRHATGVEQRMDHLPIRGIPTHQQQFLRDRFSHCDEMVLL